MADWQTILVIILCVPFVVGLFLLQRDRTAAKRERIEAARQGRAALCGRLSVDPKHLQ